MDSQMREDVSSFREEFKLNANSSKNARLQENYGRSASFIAYLQDIATLKAGDRSGTEAGGEELKAVWQYLDNLYRFGQDGKIEEGKNPLEIVLNDVTKYEAINTLELPDLKQINADGTLVLIEFLPIVASIAFTVLKTEKNLGSIKAFSEQLKMDYSTVVNDPGCCLWNELGITCWPTLLLLGPNPSGVGMNLLFTMMGEGHKNVLRVILSSALPYYQQKLGRICNDDSPDGGSRKGDALRTLPAITTDSILRYPGKIATFDELLAVADTGNHRIIVADVNGSVKFVIGGSEKGFADGDLSQAKFYFPQGLVFKDQDVLVVADTGNHCIRQVELGLGKVSTIIPPGWSYNHENETVYLRSPWDLTFFSNEILLIAAAGNHRIFAYFFESSKLFASEFSQGTFIVIAGTGKEENRNNAYILKASFAQPSGICVTNRPDNSAVIYIADSESSSIRCITTEGKGKVSAVVGGARDPTDLFSYGDVDGKGVVAKLQHPMGVCCSAKKVYFVDTYNNKVKVIDIFSQTCTTLCGSGTHGNEVGNIINANFNEPSGICINAGGEILYIADTNNHVIKAINLQSNTVVDIIFKLTSDIKSGPECDYDGTFSLAVTSTDNFINFKIIIDNVPDNFEGGQWHLNKLRISNEQQSPISGELMRNSGTCLISVQLPINDVTEEVSITADIFFCGQSSCYKRTLKFLVRLISHSVQLDCKDTCFKYEPRADFF